MTDIAYVKVFLDWTEATRKLKDAEKGRLIDAMVAYAKGEENEDQLQGNEAYVFPMFKLQIDRDRQEYEALVKRQRDNGSKGGRPKKANGLEENPKNPLVFSKTQKSQDKEEDKEKEEEKDKDKEEDKEQMLLSPISPFTNRSPLLTSAFEEWLQYKKERKDKYTETGLRNLIAQIERKADAYGDEAVADVIRLSMANGWQGIIFDRLQEKSKGTGFATGNPFLEMLEEERGR